MNRFDRTMAAVGALSILALALVFAGDTAERALGVQVAVLFAGAIFMLTGALLSLGTVAGKRGTPLRVLLALGVALLATMVFAIAHLEATETSRDADRWLGMLPSTALLLLGVFSAAMLLVVFYVIAFRTSVFGDAEEARLERESREGIDPGV